MGKINKINTFEGGKNGSNVNFVPLTQIYNKGNGGDYKMKRLSEGGCIKDDLQRKTSSCQKNSAAKYTNYTL